MYIQKRKIAAMLVSFSVPYSQTDDIISCNGSIQNLVLQLCSCGCVYLEHINVSPDLDLLYGTPNASSLILHTNVQIK